MKILRFLGVLGAFCILLGAHAVADSVCPDGSYGFTQCTNCKANYEKSIMGYNRFADMCYKTCANTPCELIGVGDNGYYGINGAYGLSNTYNVNNPHYYRNNDYNYENYIGNDPGNPAQIIFSAVGTYSCDSTDANYIGSYCPLVIECNINDSACKLNWTEVEFRNPENNNELIGTLYVVYNSVWSSHKVQEGTENSSIPDSAFYPVLRTPTAPAVSGKRFLGYSRTNPATNLVIAADAENNYGILTAANANDVTAGITGGGGSVTLYAQYEVVETTCNSGWYLLNGVCQECPKGTFPLSNAGSSSITDCFSQCEVRCKQEGCPEVGVSHVASCTYLNTNTVLDYGQEFYPGGGGCVYNGRYSEDKDGIPNCTYTVTCETDYEWSNGACVSNAPQIYHVTLDTNGGYFDANGIADIYEQYGTGWSTSANGPFNLTSLNDARLPVREGHDFNGYATNQDGTGRHGTVSSNGRTWTLPLNTEVSADTTWYAHWRPCKLDSGIFWENGMCQQCPSPYTDNPSPTSMAECYKNCSADCVQSGCVVGQNGIAGCNYDVVQYNGVMYSSSDQCVVDGVVPNCEYTVTCAEGYQWNGNSGQCEQTYTATFECENATLNAFVNPDPRIPDQTATLGQTITLPSTGLCVINPALPECGKTGFWAPIAGSNWTYRYNGQDTNVFGSFTWSESRNIDFQLRGFGSVAKNISYECGVADGTAPNSTRVYYENCDNPEIAQPTGCNTPVGAQFTGWNVKRTNIILQPGTIDGGYGNDGWPHGNAILVAQWVCTEPNHRINPDTHECEPIICDPNQYLLNGACLECPEGFPFSAGGHISINACYNTCSESCNETGCPTDVGVQSCTYTAQSYNGKVYYAAQDTCVLDDYKTVPNCEYTLTCADGYTLNNDTGECEQTTYYAKIKCDYRVYDHETGEFHPLYTGNPEYFDGNEFYYEDGIHYGDTFAIPSDLCILDESVPACARNNGDMWIKQTPREHWRWWKISNPSISGSVEDLVSGFEWNQEDDLYFWIAGWGYQSHMVYYQCGVAGGTNPAVTTIPYYECDSVNLRAPTNCNPSGTMEFLGWEPRNQVTNELLQPYDLLQPGVQNFDWWSTPRNVLLIAQWDCAEGYEWNQLHTACVSKYTATFECENATLNAFVNPDPRIPDQTATLGQTITLPSTSLCEVNPSLPDCGRVGPYKPEPADNWAYTNDNGYPQSTTSSFTWPAEHDIEFKIISVRKGERMVKYDCGVGTGTPPANTKVRWDNCNNPYVAQPTPGCVAPTGAHFTGWQVGDTNEILQPGYHNYNNNDGWPYESGIMLTARWECDTLGNLVNPDTHSCEPCPNGYTLNGTGDECEPNNIIIDWDENGGNPLDDGSCTYGGDLILANAPTYDENHVFKNWLLYNNTHYAANTVITNGCVFNHIGVYSGTSTVIKAEWCVCGTITDPHAHCLPVSSKLGECEYNTWCDEGYTIVGEGTPNPTCEKNVIHVKLEENGGSFSNEGVQDIYEQYGTGWSTSANGPFNLLYLIGDQLPTRPGHQFYGYYDDVLGHGTVTESGGMKQWTLPSNTEVSADTTWYAQWMPCKPEQFVVNGICTSCPNEYPDNPNAQTLEECYKKCSEPCKKEGCPVAGQNGVLSCNYGYVEYPGIMYNDGLNYCKTDVGNCPYTIICAEGYQLTDDGTGCEPKPQQPEYKIYLKSEIGDLHGESSDPTTLYTRYENGVYLDETRTLRMMSSYNKLYKLPKKYAVLNLYANGSADATLLWNDNWVTNAYQDYYFSFEGFYDDATAGTMCISGSGYITPDGEDLGKHYESDRAWYAHWKPGSIELPQAQYSGHLFAGWWTDPSGGVFIGFDGVSYPVERDAKLYAHWCKKCPDPMLNGTCYESVNVNGECKYTIICDTGFDQDGLDCVPSSKKYELKYLPNGGSPNEEYHEWYQFGETFTTRPGTTYAKDDHIITKWKKQYGGDFPLLEHQYQYNYTEATELTPEWKECICEVDFGAEFCNVWVEGNMCAQKAGCKPGYVHPNIECTDVGNSFCIAKCEACPAGSISVNGECACNDGYHVEGGICVPNSKVCYAPNAISAVRTWDSSVGAYGPCIVNECDEANGYYISNNACVLRTCTVEHGHGEYEQNPRTRQWECSVVKCDPGYEISDQRCTECANRRNRDGEIVVSSYASECEIAACMYQGQKYALDGNECVPICVQEKYPDDITGTIRWDERTKRCIRTCNPGYKMW